MATKYLVQLQSKPTGDLIQFVSTSKGVFVGADKPLLFDEETAKNIADNYGGIVVPWEPLKVSVHISGMTNNETLAYELERMAQELRALGPKPDNQTSINFTQPNSKMIISYEK